ncbi:unnamed protein product [Linum trigynum]|uniref:Secreted protein n=1 Tax=Linum trigynum TaxID=586398 RepID=A0AAV2CM77_9ROSI
MLQVVPFLDVLCLFPLPLRSVVESRHVIILVLRRQMSRSGFESKMATWGSRPSWVELHLHAVIASI